MRIFFSDEGVRNHNMCMQCEMDGKLKSEAKIESSYMWFYGPKNFDIFATIYMNKSSSTEWNNISINVQCLKYEDLPSYFHYSNAWYICFQKIFRSSLLNSIQLIAFLCIQKFIFSIHWFTIDWSYDRQYIIISTEKVIVTYYNDMLRCQNMAFFVLHCLEHKC